MLSTVTNAQLPTRELKHFMTLSPNQTSKPIRGAKVLSQGLYVCGAFTGTATVPGCNGLILFQGCNAYSPSTVGGGLSSPADKGFTDVTECGKLYGAAEETNSSSKLFSFDEGTISWISENVPADTSFKYIDSIAPSTLLLVGARNVKGTVVNSICEYNTVTGVVTTVGSGGAGLGPYEKVHNVYRSPDGILSFAGRNDLNTYDTKTRTLTKVTGLSLNMYLGFITNGDSMFAVGIGPHGSDFYRRVGNGGWELIGWDPLGFIGGLAQLPNDKIALLGAYNRFVMNDGNGTTINGSNLVYNQKTGLIEDAEVAGLGTTGEVVSLPNGEYFAWAIGGALYTTQSLISGVEDITDTKLTLYPNPAHSSFVIDGLREGQDILITTVAGQTLLHQKADAETFVFNTQSLAPGLIFVTTNNTTRKVIIESR